MPAPVKTIKHKLVNRGAAGLLVKPKTQMVSAPTTIIKAKAGEINFIRCEGAPIVDISSLSPDPNNARLHPERNLDEIKDSLSQYGQVKPIVVRKSDMVVLAGNGTMQCAIALGWTKIAVNIVDMGEAEGAGYGLADNRCAEHAKWDMEVLARLDRLLQESNQPTIGWSQDELEIIRGAEFVAPEVEENGEGYKPDSLTLKFTDEQQEIVETAIEAMRDVCLIEDKESPSEAEAIKLICEDWISGGSLSAPKP